MVSVGSASIDLTLNRSQFDADLRKLSQENAPDLTLQAKLDTRDFDRQIKGLAGELPTLSIPVELNLTQFKQQISQLSSYSVSILLGLDRSQFDQDLRKLQKESGLLSLQLAIDTHVADQQLAEFNSSLKPLSVRLKLDTEDFNRQIEGLQGFIPPISVLAEIDTRKIQRSAIRQQFEEIGKYAVLGFASGFSGAEDAGKDAIDSMVRSVNKQLGIQSPSKVFRQIGKYAIEGLQQGLEDLDESKLQGVTKKVEGYFENSKVKISLEVEAKNVRGKLKDEVGQKYKLEIDTGAISKAVEEGVKDASKRSPFDILVGGLLKTIGGIGSTLIGILTLPLKAAAGIAATVFAGSLNGIGETLSEGIGSGFKSAIKNLLGDSVGSGAVVGEALGEGIAKTLGVTLDALFPKVLGRVSEQVRQVLGEERVFTAAAANRSRLGANTAEQRAVATEQLQKEFASTVNSGLPARARQLKSEIDLEQPQLQADSKSFASDFAAEQQRLRSAAEKIQVKLTPEQLIEIRVKEYEKQSELIEKEIAQLEARGDKGQAGQLRSALSQIKAPDTDATKISSREVRFAEATYQSQLQNQFVSNGLSQFSDRKADLDRRSADLAPKIQEYTAITGQIGKTARGLEVLGAEPVVESKPQTARRSATPQPQIYRDIFQEVATLSGAKNTSLDLIPKLAISNDLRPGTFGNYNPEQNQISVSKEAYNLIQESKLDAKAIETLVHELRHALQFDFGKTDVANGEKPGIPLINPTPEETRQLGRRVESSVEIQKPELQPITRQLEADAYTFASRNSPQIQQKLEKQSATQELEGTFGLGGSKAELQIKRSQVEAIKRLSAITNLAQDYGFDIQHEFQASLAALEQITQSLSPILSRAADLAPLTAQEILQIQKDLELSLGNAIAAIQEEPIKLKAVVSSKLESSRQNTAAKVEPTPNKSEELEANLNRLHVSDTRLLAGRLGVPLYDEETKKRLKKPELVQRVLKNVDPQTLESSLPAVGKPSTEVLAEAKRITAIPPEELKLQIQSFAAQVKGAFESAKKAQGETKVSLLTQVLDDIYNQEELVTQALAQDLEKSIKAPLEGFRLGLTKRKYQALGEIGSANLEQQQKSSNLAIPSTEQRATRGNSFDLASSEDINNIVAAAKAQALKLASQFKNGKQNSSAYGDFYEARNQSLFKNLEGEAKAREDAAKKSLEQTKRELEASIKLLEQEQVVKRELQKVDSRLAGLESLNQIDPSVGADVAIADNNQERSRKQRVIDEVRSNPIGFFQDRTKSATVQKARYITENAEGIANLVGSKLGSDGATPTQAKNLVQLQQRFGDLGEAATRFGSNQSPKNFQQLDSSVKALEKSLKELGVPFSHINQEIDIYTNKLKKLQGEGKISVNVDVESLAPQKFSFLDNVISKLSGVEAKGLSVVGNIAKGFFAFNGFFILQNLFAQLTAGAFKAYVETDKLKTALNFASGGSGAGAANLKFVNKEVDDLAIPLQASIQGFTQLTAAARGTNLEGQQTKDIFDGLSKASTVLSLSADDTSSAFDAFSKAITQGKVSAETFEQLGTRIPGIYGTAARAIGTTEEELKRLIETGQVGSDGVGRIGKQLQSEYGRDSEGASDNAQSAVFKLQNSSQKFQQGIGEGLAPVVIPGLKILTGALESAAGASKELLAILSSVAVVMSANIVNALRSVITNLVLTRAATGTLGGAFQTLAQTVNNSFEVKLGAAVFGVIEIIKLLNDQVNTDLVKSFEASADAATRAAEASEKAFEAEQNRRLGKKPAPEKEEVPIASSGTGRFADKYLINPANFVLQHTFTDIPKFATTGQSEKTRVLDNDKVEQQATTELLAGAKLRESEIKNQSGELGKLPQIDKDLRDKSNQRQILEAQSKRNFTDKGLAIPAKIQTQLAQESTDINALTNKRSEIAKPYDDTLADLNQRLNAYKAKLEGLKRPEVIDNLGQKKVDELTESYKKNIEAILLQKNSLAAAQSAFNVNPILTFNDAFRKLNLTLAEGQETNQQRAADRNLESARTSLSGFSSNRLASKQRNITDAITSRDLANSDAENQQKLLDGLNSQLNAPGLQPQLQRLGVSPTSSVAQVDDILSNTKDESDKAILEKVKASRQQELKTTAAKQTAVGADEKVKQVAQENTLSEIQFGAANVQAAVQRSENTRTAAVKRGLQDRTISETEAAEKIARIQLGSTQTQQRSIALQLQLLNESHSKGIVGAELFAEKQRELTTEQTSLQEQQAERQLAVFEAVNARKLEALDLANKKAEAVINQTQSSGTLKVKQGVLDGRLDTLQAPEKQNKVDIDTNQRNIALTKTKLNQNEENLRSKTITKKQYDENRIALTQQLGQDNIQAVDLQIQAEDQKRTRFDKEFQRRGTQLELNADKRNTGVQQSYLDSFKASSVDEKGLELTKTGATLNNQSVTDAKQVSLLQEELAGVDKLGLAEKDAADKKIALNIQIEHLRQQQIQTEIDLIKNKQEIEINGIERAAKAEENRFKLADSDLDQEKAKIELISQSLDRTKSLQDSRANLSKASSDLTVSGLEIRKDTTNRALDLSRKLEDPNIDPRLRSVINSQLGAAGFSGLSAGATAEQVQRNEVKILETRAKIEDEIASKKLEALKTEQAYQKQSLELDLKKQAIAAQSAVFDAESGQLSAARSKLEAEAELKKAQIKKDPLEIATAKVGLELANRDIELSDRKLQFAKDGVDVQAELAKNAEAAQDATQKGAVGQLVASSAAQKQATALEKVEALVKSATKSSGGDADSGTPKDFVNPFTPLKGESQFDYDLRINKARTFGQIQDTKSNTLIAGAGFTLTDATATTVGDGSALTSLSPSSNGASPKIDVNPLGKNSFNPKPGENLFEAYQRQRETADAVSKSTVKPVDTTAGYAQFTESLKSANQGIEARLDKLLDSFMTVNNTPRSLTVTTPNPVDDAASIINSLSRGELMGAGL